MPSPKISLSSSIQTEVLPFSYHLFPTSNYSTSSVDLHAKFCLLAVTYRVKVLNTICWIISFFTKN